jgi:CRP-like cAMP-binding protein
MNENALTKATKQELDKLNNLFDKYGTNKKVPKGKQIIVRGEKSDFFFYVKKGGFKSYISRGDRDYILGFSFVGFIDCCPYALFSKNTNTYTLEAYTESEIIKVSLNNLEKFIKENIGFDKFIQSLLIDYINVVENTLFDLVSKTAEERYIDLCKNYGEVLDLISLSDMAKYLGITQERLSRIRKKMT